MFSRLAGSYRSPTTNVAKVFVGVFPRQSGINMPSGVCAARLFSSSQRAAAFNPESLTNTYEGRKTFDKILIANRGEIACRIMKTCKKMGIKTVAVYSEPDAGSLHVAMADEAVCIGPAASAESYLRYDKIIDACKATGAQAVHPGYGFLSENFHFVQQLEKNDIAHIGPSHRPMELLGDKIQSKIVAKEAGVSTIPGFKGVIEDEDHAVRVANEITYPVMVKASAGGGGKGMRIAWNDEEVKEGYRLSKAEAKSSFGDDRLLIEKYVDNPRHIEIQLIADSHGNCVYLNERDCSIQRRNQKVIEEAPSTFLDEETRAAMGAEAVLLAKAVDYTSAGTIECLVDSQKNFYFLEMNTRLQVEHPVSELVSGVDLVELMIDVAAGHPLPITQKDVVPKGFAIECRVYAENPKNFLPCTGRLQTYKEPTKGYLEKGLVRVDSGIFEGSEISIYYDPMISKLITYGKDRTAALALMTQALDEYVIEGLIHNIPILREMINHPKFVNGDCTTKFIGEEYPEGFNGHKLLNKELAQLLVSACYMKTMKELRATEFYNQSRIADDYCPPEKMEYVITVDGESHKVDAILDTPMSGDSLTEQGVRSIVVNGVEVDTRDMEWDVDSTLFQCHVHEHDDFNTLQYLGSGPSSMKIRHCGTVYNVEVLSKRENDLKKYMIEKPKIDMSKVVASPMPGSVYSVFVKPGDRVAEGMEVAIVEAMKMQNGLRSPRDGIVKAVHFTKGDTVQYEDVIIEFEEDEPAEAASE
eukprot:Nk52_evm3s745 gene=Nk52_evmTU3s745